MDKIITIVGTRPELIRLSVLIKKLDERYQHNHILVYTNQNYDYNLSTKFFEDLDIRKPNYFFKQVNNGFTEFLYNSFIELGSIVEKEKPNKALILGDTNSGLLGLILTKLGVPIFHMEAGNRCYDNKVPEETNRKIIDSFSKYNLPYTNISKNNLIGEGFDKSYVYKTGNPILEVLNFYEDSINKSKILSKLNITSKNYVLVTLHRSENVDNRNVLTEIIESINEISKEIKVVLSLHPRTKDKLEKFNIKLSDNVIASKPFGFFDFVNLEKNSKLILTDSGTVQEEACILHVPCVIVRDSTERFETIESGSAILSGVGKKSIIQSFTIASSMSINWVVPKDYLVTNVSDVVLNILSGKK